MLIQVYNPDLTLKTVLNRFSSLQHVSNFYENGSFELHSDIDAVDVNDVIVFSAYGRTYGGIALKKVQTMTDNQVLGVDLKGVLSFRYNISTANISSAHVAGFIHDYIFDILPSGYRALPTVDTGWDNSIGAVLDSGPRQVGFLDEIVNNLSNQYGVGVTCEFDMTNRKLWFKCGQGTDRDGVVFSSMLKSSTGDTFTDDISGTYTIAYVQGAWRGTSTSGLLRREGASNETVTGYMDPSVLLEHQRGQIMECQPTDKFKLGVDYFLGDKVKVKFGNTVLNEQITSVEQVYERENTLLNITLGKIKTNTLRKVLR